MAQMTIVERDGIEAGLSNASSIPAIADFVKRPTQTVTCAKPGVLGVLTPMPNRNRDSLQKSLEAQGFRRVALPEIRLFDPFNTGDFVTLFQKPCKAGETVKVGKWGVPIWFD